MLWTKHNRSHASKLLHVPATHAFFLFLFLALLSKMNNGFGGFLIFKSNFLMNLTIFKSFFVFFTKSQYENPCVFMKSVATFRMLI